MITCPGIGRRSEKPAPDRPSPGGTFGDPYGADLRERTDLQVSTRQERKAVSMALSRLVEEGVIERAGNRHGCFRRIEGVLEPINYLQADTSPVSIPVALQP